ncbi:DUF374 domain-containing protein [Prosthecochloris sp. ZM_2]|uniref:DUF374 domain-containing protein n=1 Tax=Prosthecochloris sp. ZM_2 TaxID=2045206 RepID=UPI000DF7A5D3|nr:DUF374 domain-containing protein [Prosthecochloris sp. ZM_2]RNA64385.1 DUF374 domain-containing protein [Prosthecochloris sp. ZM_2]
MNRQASKQLLAVLSRHLLPGLLRLLCATLKTSVNITTPLPRKGHGMILAFWHGNMLNGWILARTLTTDRSTAAVVSLSDDGRILAEALRGLGFSLIRGSSSRGGGSVRDSMLHHLDNGGVIAITPDGPRGPRHRFKYGTLELASRHAIPLLFARIHCHRSWKLNSWDRFEIPRPFSRVDMTVEQLDLPPLHNRTDTRKCEEQLAATYATP